jgi:hypothetical protein
MSSSPVVPKPPALLAVDPFAAEEAVAALRAAADAALYERERQHRSFAIAAVTWIGRERERAASEAASIERAWFDVELELRRAATLTRLAVDDALHENGRRQRVYEDALAEYREARAAASRTDAVDG